MSQEADRLIDVRDRSLSAVNARQGLWIRLCQGSLALLVVTLFALGCGLAELVAPPADPCPGANTCNSPAVPGGQVCCVVGDAVGATVGYLCAFGADKQPAGCVARLETARMICPNAPSIVRCVRGG